MGLKGKQLPTKSQQTHCLIFHIRIHLLHPMAMATGRLLILLLQLSFLFNNLVAKRSSPADHDHDHDHHHRRGSHGRSDKYNNSTSNPRLQQAYIALQAWKRVIYSDPNKFTSNWVGPSVCSYNGVYCSAALDDPKIKVVAGIDLNHVNIAGFLPDDLGLLTDLALLHLNSNRFCGIIPESFANLTLLFELDISNNRFVGPFPSVVLSLPTLKFLDIRFNEFEGALPPDVFNRGLDAIFVNNNLFTSVIPSTFGASGASVVVFANNMLGGCLPPSIAKLADSLEELLLFNTSLTGCLPQEIGFLYKLRVLDVSYNKVVGTLPYSIAGLAHLEQLVLGHNMMTGNIPEGICILPNLMNFTYSYNFFCEEEGICRNMTANGIKYDDRRNCLPGKPLQRSKKECEAVYKHPVDCLHHHCSSGPAIAAVPAASPLASPPIHS